jgi:predicted nuclease with TOPRIM domain
MAPAKRSDSSVGADSRPKRARRSATPAIKKEVKDEEIDGEDEAPNPLESSLRQKDAEIAQLKTRISEMPLKIDAATSPLEEIIRTKDGQISDLEKRIFELQ